MRTVSELSKMDGRVYVYLCDQEVRQKFLKDAEAEGVIFGDGVKPTERPDSDIYAINQDCTINFVGFVGHILFRNPKNVVGKPLIRVDYEKYILGSDDYVI